MRNKFAGWHSSKWADCWRSTHRTNLDLRRSIRSIDWLQAEFWIGTSTAIAKDNFVRSESWWLVETPALPKSYRQQKVWSKTVCPSLSTSQAENICQETDSTLGNSSLSLYGFSFAWSLSILRWIVMNRCPKLSLSPCSKGTGCPTIQNGLGTTLRASA